METKIEKGQVWRHKLTGEEIEVIGTGTYIITSTELATKKRRRFANWHLLTQYDLKKRDT